MQILSARHETCWQDALTKRRMHRQRLPNRVLVCQRMRCTCSANVRHNTSSAAAGMGRRCGVPRDTGMIYAEASCAACGMKSMTHSLQCVMQNMAFTREHRRANIPEALNTASNCGGAANQQTQAASVTYYANLQVCLATAAALPTYQQQTQDKSQATTPALRQQPEIRTGPAIHTRAAPATSQQCCPSVHNCNSMKHPQHVQLCRYKA